MQVVPISDKPPIARYQSDPIRSIARAALAKAVQVMDRARKPEAIASERWPFDSDVQLLLRAASAPRDMTNTAALMEIGYAVLPMLRPYSAAARLFEAALSITFGREGAITVPSFGLANVAMVGGGVMKPVVQALTGGARLDPRKLAGIAVASEELLATDSAEVLIRDMLASSAGPALDAAVFSNAAASADSPAGILNGLTPLTASAATGINDSLIADMTGLGGAIAPISGSGPIAFVMNPAQLFSLTLRTFRSMEPDILLLPSGSLPVGTVIGVALNGLVSAVSPPEFESGTHAMLSMNDAPTAWPGGPVQSLFQTASAAVKMVTWVSWAVRSPLAVATVSSVKW
jgi:hypothetical protein